MTPFLLLGHVLDADRLVTHLRVRPFSGKYLHLFNTYLPTWVTFPQLFLANI